MSIKRYFHGCEPGSESYLPLCEHPEGMWVLYGDHVAEVERLTAERDEAYTQHDDFRAAINDAIASLGVWYMDPPDGGGVDQPEFISRAVDDLLHLRKEVERLQARVREMEATLRQMHEEAKRDEVTQAPTASVYKAYRLAQQRETIEAVAERLGVSLAAARLRAALDALGGTS